MSIIYNRVVSVKLPKGTVGNLRAIQTEIEEKFSSKEHFIDWYNDNHDVKIDESIKPKFVSAPTAGETVFRFLTTNREKVLYRVV